MKVVIVFSRYSELLKPSARGLAIVQSAVDIKKFFVARCSAQQKNYRIAARLRSMDRSEEKIFFTEYRNFSTHCSVCEKKSPNTCTCTRTRDVSDVRKLFWKSFLQLQKKFLQQQKNFFWGRNYFSGKKLSEKVFAHKKLFWKSFLWSQKKFLRSRKDFSCCRKLFWSWASPTFLPSTKNFLLRQVDRIHNCWHRIRLQQLANEAGAQRRMRKSLAYWCKYTGADRSWDRGARFAKDAALVRETDRNLRAAELFWRKVWARIAKQLTFLAGTAKNVSFAVSRIHEFGEFV